MMSRRYHHNAVLVSSSSSSSSALLPLLLVVSVLSVLTVLPLAGNRGNFGVAAQQQEEDDNGDGLFEPCLVCIEDGWAPLDPDVLIDGPVDDSSSSSSSTTTCQQMYEDGLAGIISPSACPIVQALADPDCGCSPPDFVCYVCGSSEENVKATNVEFQIPTLTTSSSLEAAAAVSEAEEQEGGNNNGNGGVSVGSSTVTCGEIQRQGLAGLISPSECDQIPVYARSPCQCAPTGFDCSICGEGTGDDGGVQIITNPQLDIPPNTIFGLTSTVSCQELEDLATTGQLTPQQCTNAELTVQSVCGCAPLGFTCNICGPDLTQVVTAPDELALFPSAANPQFTCGELQELGNTPNGLTPDVCIAVQNLAVQPCQCGDESDVPAVGDDVDNNNVDGDGEGNGDGDGDDEEEFVPCNICGQDGYTVANKDASVSIPAGLGTNVAAETVVCGDVEQQAFLGQVSATNCQAWVPFIFSQCTCVRDPNFVPPTLPPTTPSPTAPPTTETDTTTDAPVSSSTDAPISPPSDAPVSPPSDAPVSPPTDAPVPPPTDTPVPPPTEAPVPPPTDVPVDDEDPVQPAPTAGPTEMPVAIVETDAPIPVPVVPPTPVLENGLALEPTLVPMELPATTPVPEEDLPTEPPISGTTGQLGLTFFLSSSILTALMSLLFGI